MHEARTVGRHYLFIIYKPWDAAMEAFLLAIILYDNTISMTVALYVLANSDVLLTISPRQVDL